MFLTHRRLLLSLVTVTSILKPTTAFSMSSSNYGTQIDRFISSDYHTVGSVLKLKDETEFYCTGNPRGKQGVILIPDTMGWNAGRIRNIADFFGDNNCLAVIPKLMGTPKSAEGKYISLSSLL
ncbi:hypothetical protein EON64_03935 [archaeon]|nr:MAG: hypothetical protein EON64_03935 [archaeon]